jgi:cytochrome P450
MWQEAAMTVLTTGVRAPDALSEGTDLGAELYGADPYPAYRRLRRAYPVLEAGGEVHVFRHDDVAAVLRHPRVSAGGRLAPAYLSQLDDRSFLRRDPPGRTRLRKLAAAGFTSRRVEALRPFIQRQADRVVDAAAPAGHLDLVAGLAWPLPIEVICELLGIPAGDRAFVATWPRTQLCCLFEPGSLKTAAELARSEPGNPRQAEAGQVQQRLTISFAGTRAT